METGRERIDCYTFGLTISVYAVIFVSENLVNPSTLLIMTLPFNPVWRMKSSNTVTGD